MGETVVTDGRASRANKTRLSVVDALLTLIERGNLRPTARQIADEAGVSLRSVYVHFDDVESLFVAAADRHFERMQARSEPWLLTGSLDERLAALTRRRRRVYEDGAEVWRAARLQEPFSPVLRRALELGRAAGRVELDKVFAAELAAVAATERTRLRTALEVVVSPNTWETLRYHEHLPPDEADSLVGDMARAVLRAWGLPLPTKGKPPPTAAIGPPG